MARLSSLTWRSLKLFYSPHWYCFQQVSNYRPAERVGGPPKDPPETAEVTRLSDTFLYKINQAPWYIKTKRRVKTVTELARHSSEI